ncbi:hypothetical protein DMB65_00370 [Flavobacterium cheongpyeongense]|uniref:LVIVD repeat-containing protein n=1 Tax=Flavobacterium cheongpyeongense TaxID=2212651 RepID=A0A2V4BV62_9FLAO|nr:hypothetical protein [Flavobacterium cheongpyeongense]PXY42517.1 hypothetical protein DMB65_00370 [Flavobacterium cheongpyeongense]
MKKTLLLLLIACSVISCLRLENNETLEENQYKPVLVQRSVFEKSIVLENAQTITKSGKIYIKGDLMFINDVNKGFHVYDYSDPKNPVPLQFIKVPGATDLAIIDDIIYINQAVDLVALTYNATTKKIKITNRNKNVFPQKKSPNGFSGNHKENEIIIDWKVK